MLWFKTVITGAHALFLLLVVCCSLAARGQSSPDDFGGKVRVVPSAEEPAPFAAARVHRNPVYSIKFEAPDQTVERNRLLIANSEATIAELAGSSGLEYSGAGWKAREIACPGFANHLFLQYSRDNDRGDVSVFSASIPKNGMGRIRLIPILKRSYSLFSPAPINAMTISAFNHIRAEEGESANMDWLGNALCYAALAGAQPEILPTDSWPSSQTPVAQFTSALDVQFNAKGQEVITFDDVAARPHAMEWTMTFTRQGKLIKATHKAAGTLRAQPIPETSAVTKSHQLP